VLADGTRLVTTDEHTLLQIPPSGRLATVAGTATAAQDEAEDEDEEGNNKRRTQSGFLDATGTRARFHGPYGLTVDKAGSVVVVDGNNNAIRTVSKVGAVVSTLAGNGEAGSADGQGVDAAFNDPTDVVLAANGDLLLSDTRSAW